MFLQETYEVEDCYLYDDASSDKSSNYTTKSSGLSISHDTDHYVVSPNASNQFIDLLSGVDNVRFEVTLKAPSKSGGISITESSLVLDVSSNVYTNASGTTYLVNFPYTNVKSQSGIINTSDYFKYVMETNSSSISVKVENSSGTSVFSSSTSKSLSAKHYSIFLPASNSIHVKKIKIKAL